MRSSTVGLGLWAYGVVVSMFIFIALIGVRPNPDRTMKLSNAYH